MKKYRFRWRIFTSLALFIGTMVVTVSGIALYVAPHHRIANEMGWTLLFLDQGQWWDLHLTSMIVFMLAFGFHLFKFNWRAFLHYMGRKTKGAIRHPVELLVSVLLTVILIWGTLANWAVTNWVLDLHKWMRAEYVESWQEWRAEKYGDG